MVSEGQTLLKQKAMYGCRLWSYSEIEQIMILTEALCELLHKLTVASLRHGSLKVISVKKLLSLRKRQFEYCSWSLIASSKTILIGCPPEGLGLLHI